MKIKTDKLLKIFKIFNSFVKIYGFFVSDYMNFVRLYSNNDKKIYCVVNNATDTKLIYSIDIDIEIEFDEIYMISEIYNILNNILHYSYFTLHDDKIFFGDDGFFTLSNIDLPEEKIEKLYSIDTSINEKYFEYDFIVDDDITSEITDIFNILTQLKSTGINTYFYKDDSLVFNFKDILVKKNTILSFMITDIVSLKIISMILLNSSGNRINYYRHDGYLVLKSDDFYIITKICDNTNDEQNLFLYNYFSKLEDNVQDILKLKLEFYNFVNIVSIFDNDSTIVINDNKAYIESKYKNYIGEFILEDLNIDFIVFTSILSKILDFLIKNKKIDSINFKIISIYNSKFLHFKNETIDILTEII